MSQPTGPAGTDPQQPGPARAETSAFPAAPAPAPAPPVVDAPPVGPAHAAVAPTRRGRVLMGAAGAGLLAVGVVVGLVVGQATAGTASAGDLTPSTSQTVPGAVPDDGSGQGYGSMPGGGPGHGGTGRFGGVPGDGTTGGGVPGDGTTGGTTGGGTTDDTVDGTTQDS